MCFSGQSRIGAGSEPVVASPEQVTPERLRRSDITKTILALALFAITVGCGGNFTPVTPAQTVNQFFNRSMVGQKWTFVNGYGDHTTIEVQAPPAGSEVDVGWHYTKDNCRAYWNSGDCTSELWFGLKENPDHSWSSNQFVETCSSCITGSTEGSVTIIPSASGGYLIVPPGDHFTTGQTGYFPCWTLGQLEWTPNHCNVTGATPLPWLTNGFMDAVNTPAYSGPALVSEQLEGTCPDHCTWEKWYFAAGIGLVKVQQIQAVNAIGVDHDDPLLGMVRVH